MNYFFKKSVCVFRLVVYFEEKRRRLKLFFIFIFFLVLPANAIQFKPLFFFFFQSGKTSLLSESRIKDIHHFVTFSLNNHRLPMTKHCNINPTHQPPLKNLTASMSLHLDYQVHPNLVHKYAQMTLFPLKYQVIKLSDQKNVHRSRNIIINKPNYLKYINFGVFFCFSFINYIIYKQKS